MRETNRIAGNGTDSLKSAEPSSNGQSIFEKLAAPFPANAIGWKAQTVSGERALAVAFIDARSVMDRLDGVIGPENWRDSYRVNQSGNVVCGLSLRLNGEWVPKFDVGGRSDQEDGGDQEKAAFSDALKRAAVKWGIGRYLYSLPKQWADYDPRKKQLKEVPQLPSWALPNGQANSVPTARSTNGSTTVQNAEKRPSSSCKPESRNGEPHTGRELFRWLTDQERALVADQLARLGELVERVAQAGAAAGHGDRIVKWNAPAVAIGVAEAERFISGRKGEPIPSSSYPTNGTRA